MRGTNPLILAVALLFGSLCANAQNGGNPARVILPNPQLIHCHAAACSQLWKENPAAKVTVYPSQVLTDVVNGEVVGLTAVYDKSVPISKIREAVDAQYGRWKHADLCTTDKICIWRVEAEQYLINLSTAGDHTQLIYLKFAKTLDSLQPSAHIYGEKK